MSLASTTAYALSDASSGYHQAAAATNVVAGDNQSNVIDGNKSSNSAQINSPTVNSIMYSGAQFPQQNALTGTKDQVYNAAEKKDDNSPTVNSLMYSGAQFPQQNNLSGKKKQQYYTKDQLKVKTNNPNVNSRLYSGAQFTSENSFNNNGKTPNTSSANADK